MSDLDWIPVGTADPQQLAEARLRAHQAVQWLARGAYANLAPAPGDAHANLGWSGIYGALMTRSMAGEVALGLRLRDLTLFVEHDECSSVALLLDGTGNAEAGLWVAEELGRYGLAPGTFHDGLPYGEDLPARVTGIEGLYATDDVQRALTELSSWFANADAVLRKIHAENADLSPGPSEVRCWPHHFDIATLISLDDGDLEQARSIGVGMSPGDGSVDQPYFYVSPWPAPDAASLPPLPGIGRWNTEGFVGAVATRSEIAAVADQGSAALEFLRSAVAACRSVLQT